MAASSVKSLHQPLLHRRYHPHSHSSSIFLQTQFPPKLHWKPHCTSYSSLTAALSPSSSSITNPATTSTLSDEDNCSFSTLAAFLASRDYRQADEETRRLLILLAGEAAQKRGYVFFSEVQFISADDLRAIDALWLQHSDGKFGYSVQRRAWEKSRRDFTKFFIKVGWMKKLDTEIEQYNYRAFPDEFIWNLEAGTPEGHLPLTNALRGTQLLKCILTHPAFEESFREEDSKYDDRRGMKDEEKKEEEKKEGRERFRLLKSFKTDYSF